MLVTPTRKRSTVHQPNRVRAFLRRHWRWGSITFLAVFAFCAGTRFPATLWLARTRLQSAVASVPAHVEHAGEYLESVVRSEVLPVLTIDMKFKYVARLEAKRAEAMKDGWLQTSDDDFVPAQLTYAGGKTDVKVRLKGDRIAHIDGQKWSFRVKVKGDDRPFGMRSFSLHHPQTRGYLTEWAFLENARREGFLAVRYQFVRLMFNGEDKGIYALEEHFTKELLESQGRREGVIVAFEERPAVHYDIAKRWAAASNDIAVRLSAVESQDLRSFDTSHVESDPILRDQLAEAMEMLRSVQEGRRAASDVFDVELMGRYMALVDFWQAGHAMLWQNSRYYYNPVTARLEPIGFDAMALWGDCETPAIVSRVDDRFLSGPLRDPEIVKVYLRELERLSSPDYLASLKDALGPFFDRWRLALQREFPSRPHLVPPWDRLAARQVFIRSILHPEQMVIAHATVEDSPSSVREGYTRQVVEVRNVALLPVEVVGFRVGDGPLIPAADVWSASESDQVWRTGGGAVGVKPGAVPLGTGEAVCIVSFTLVVPARVTDVQGAEASEIRIATRFPGQTDVHWTPVRTMPRRRPYGPVPVEPTVAEAVGRHPFLAHRPGANALSIYAGTWQVQGDLVLPRGMALDVEAGATLRFEPDAILYATAPVNACGEPDAPVVFESSHGQWGGVVIINAAERSDWSNVVVRDTSQMKRGGWMLTGGVTFYHSDVSMSRVQFNDHGGEDALNVIHAHATLWGCEFNRCHADAFDGDFVNARVDSCSFVDVAGDAIDFSGSQVQVTDLHALRVADKAVSAGEGSELSLEGLSAHDVGIGIAAKDSSVVEAQNVHVDHARIGLAAYQKKTVFGPGRISARGVRLTNVQQRALTQTESSILMDGVEQSAGKLDIKQMYAIGILGN